MTNHTLCTMLFSFLQLLHKSFSLYQVFILNLLEYVIIYKLYREMDIPMKKLLLLGIITFITFAHAKIIDAIAVVVEGEPITTAEIRAIQAQMSVSKKEATDLLIQDRLQKSAMKDVTIDEAGIDSKISGIAAQNNLTVPKMQEILKEQGTSWSKYRNSVRDAMKKEKFFQDNVLNTIAEPTEDELKLYYNNHKEAFVAPKNVSLIEYSASSEQK